MRMKTRELWIGMLVAVLAAGPTFAQDNAGQENAGQEKKAEDGAKAEKAEGGAPKLQLSATEWDFGTKWYAEKAETEIALENVGDAPLRITKVTSSCGCTVAKPSSAATWNGMVIKPGEKEIMKLSYNTKKVRPTVSQAITITSNDPVMPTARIQVKGAIKQLFEMTPAPRITFTQMERDSVETKEITLTSNLKDENVTLKLGPLPEDSPFDVKLETVTEGKEYKLVATTKPPLKLGSNAIQVQLSTSHEKFDSLQVPISAYVAPRVQISPTTLFVPRGGTASIQRYVRVRYQADSPIEITEIKVGDESVKAELIAPRTTPHPKATILMHEIRVTLPPASEFPADGTTITVLTNDKEPQYQKFEVEVKLQPESSARRTPAVHKQANQGDEDENATPDDDKSAKATKAGKKDGEAKPAGEKKDHAKKAGKKAGGADEPTADDPD